MAWWDDPSDPMYRATKLTGMPTAYGLKPEGPVESVPIRDRIGELASWMGNALPGRGGVHYNIPVPREIRMAPFDEIPKLMKPILRAAPDFTKTQFDVKTSRPVIMKHEVAPPIDDLDRFGIHTMDLGVVPQGTEKPIRVGEILFSTRSDKPVGKISTFERDPRILMHPAEFEFLRSKFNDLVRAFGVQEMTSSPLSASRNRLFRNMGRPPEHAGRPYPIERRGANINDGWQPVELPN